MKRKISYISAAVVISLFLSVSEAQAIVKLDFFEPIADVAKFVEKTLSKYENIYNQYVEKLNEKLTKALGNEGMKLFKEFLVKPGTMYLSAAATGQFNANDSAGTRLFSSYSRLIGNEKLEYAYLSDDLKDLVDTKEKEKQDKLLVMEDYLVRLQSEREALNAQLENPDLQTQENLDALEEYDKRIAALQTELEKTKSQKVLEDEEVKEKIQQKKAKQEDLLEKADKASWASLDEKLNSVKVEEMFGSKIDEEETEDLYRTGVEKFFLRENEDPWPENLERIMRARHEEYYEAEKNLWKVMVNTHKSISETEEYMKKCLEAAPEAEGRFGTASMRVCIELQNAKAAAQYMEMLLAQVRFETTKEIQTWNDKYKMKDYEHDMTSLDLDEYVLKKKDVKKEKENPAFSSGGSFGIGGFKF